MRYELVIVAALLFVGGSGYCLNWLSYRVLKHRIIRRRVWDLNVCCGRTDGGGVNADIVRHVSLPNFCCVDVEHLPFRDRAFGHVLCSHTLEHVDDPQAFYDELARVGDNVTLILPPLWDWSAALNVLEHKWLFLSFRTEHDRLPRYVRLPGADIVQRWRGQRIKA